MDKFIGDFLNGDLEEWKMGEPLPRNRDAIFKTVVRDNFDRIVKDPSRHVIVSFVTDWCEHCKEIKQMYKDIK